MRKQAFVGSKNFKTPTKFFVFQYEMSLKQQYWCICGFALWTRWLCKARSGLLKPFIILIWLLLISDKPISGFAELLSLQRNF